jgi:hypothetical protein
MAASCGPSITQFAMDLMQCDQNDDKRSFQDVRVSDGNVLMMLTAVSTKRAGTTIECPVAPSIIFLAPRRLLAYSQQDTPGFLSLQTCLSVLSIHSSPKSSPRTTVKIWFMQDGSLPTCILSQQRPPLGPPYNYRANAWRCYTFDSCWLLILHYVPMLLRSRNPVLPDKLIQHNRIYASPKSSLTYEYILKYLGRRLAI